MGELWGGPKLLVKSINHCFYGNFDKGQKKRQKNLTEKVQKLNNQTLEKEKDFENTERKCKN